MTICPAAGQLFEKTKCPAVFSAAWAESLLALRARALAKFGEVDTVPVSENSFNKKKYKNIRKKSIQKIKKKKYKIKARNGAQTRNTQVKSARPRPLG